MYKTILVHVDQTAHSVQRIDIAARLALQNEAHLIGAAATGLAAYMFPVASLNPEAPAVIFPIEELRAQAQRSLDQFDRLADLAGVHSFERSCLDEEAGTAIAMQGRYCDLIVISQTPPDEYLPRLRSDFPEYVVLNCTRPVLVLPHTGGKGEIGKRVLIAWNGSDNAVRAVTSAIPMLRLAAEVNVVVFNAGSDGDRHGELPGADIASYLARHGVPVTVTAVDTSTDSGDAILSFAAEKEADLIVMGAYGHSRFSEIMLGSASRTALRSSPIALWMAH